MKIVYSLLSCAFIAASLCSCSQNSENKLHDQCVEIYKNEQINEAQVELEALEREVSLYEYILNIEDDEEFLKAVKFISSEGDEAQSFVEELENFEKEADLRAELAENKANDAETLVDSRANSLNE